MSEPKGDHIHTPHDGRGHRTVLLDGVVVDRVVYADTELGFAVAMYDPPRPILGTDYADIYPLWGDITVKPLEAK